MISHFCRFTNKKGADVFVAFLHFGTAVRYTDASELLSWQAQAAKAS